MHDLATLEANLAIAEPPHTLGPLAALLNPSGYYAVEAGETFEISLTLHNQGPHGAVIDAYFDESSKTFCQWCSNPYERLALEVGHSNEVRFKVAIPIQTLPGTYDYLIVVDAPDHYPEDTPLRYPATVRVLPPVQSAINLNDATFATRPETSSDKPIRLQPATPTEVQVIVHNRSNRVDQFRLEITDLPEDWYQIAYPEGLGELGLVIDTDHLALNPGMRGIVRLVVNSPAAALAGRYLATLRLRSANQPDLVLMDMLYFEMPAVYNLQVRAEGIVRKVKRQAALFHLHITNAGNTAREISLRPQEDREDPLFTYGLEPARLRIPSMTTAHVTLTASPAKMRQRAWMGRGRQVTFRLEVDDHHSLPLPEVTTAELLWERRPWWHLALVLLLAAGAVSTAVGLVWWLLLRPPAPPKVTSFGTTAPTFYQQQNDFVRLNWQIENAKQIQALELSSQATEGATTTQPITYDLSGGLPPELAEVCVLEKTLSCSNVLTGARQPGQYQFTLTVLPKRDRTSAITAETGAIAVLPTPPPKIQTFAATQPRYWEALDSKSAPDKAAPDKADSSAPKKPALNWRVTFTNPLSHLIVTTRLADGTDLDTPQRYDLSEGLPDSLKDFCTLNDSELTCRDLPTAAQTVGTYIFELKVFASESSEPIATAATQPVQIVPAPVRIEQFTINGEPAPTKYQVVLPADAKAADKTVELAWQVDGGPYTQVEILPTPGSVPLAGNLAYPLTANTQEVVTLVVTSVSGEKITRSVTLEVSQAEALPPSSAQVPSTQTLPPPPEPTTPPPPESVSNAAQQPAIEGEQHEPELQEAAPAPTSPSSPDKPSPAVPVKPRP